jgi:trehalose-6-phosphate synthase
MQGKLNGSRLFAVSNREPYEHVASREFDRLVGSSQRPGYRAGTGAAGQRWNLDRAGTGDADKETADDRGRLRVPPDHPQYTLRRVWLSKEEEDGFYFGFANEGLWPLCHIAHTRPGLPQRGLGAVPAP